MTRQEKISFIVENFQEFNKDTPQEWRDILRGGLQCKSDSEIQKEYEFTHYLLGK